MALIEAEKPFFTPKDQRKLGRLEEKLREAGGTCNIDVFAMAHDWEPDDATVQDVRGADVVTLELTRNVVKAGLATQQSNILEGNIFWRRIIDELREGNEEKLIRGVSVNQTVRNGLKRLLLHCGNETLTPALLVVEAKQIEPSELREFLSGDEIDFFGTHNWIIVDHAQTQLDIMERTLAVFDQRKSDGLKPPWPVPLSDNLSLVSENLDRKEIFNNRHTVTFMKSPDRSLIHARSLVIELLGDQPIRLSKDEKETIANDSMLAFILSHAELKDAEEILYSVYQFATKFLREKKSIKAAHVGGAAHGPTIARILNSSIQDRSVISVSVKDDPRFLHPLVGSDLFSFVKETIPPEELISGINVNGFETYADPEHIRNAVSRVVEENMGEFVRRLFVQRLMRRVASKYTLASMQERNQFRNELYLLDLEELRTMVATPKNQS